MGVAIGLAVTVSYKTGSTLEIEPHSSIYFSSLVSSEDNFECEKAVIPGYPLRCRWVEPFVDEVWLEGSRWSLLPSA